MQELQVTEYQNHRVLTTAQLADGYGAEPRRIVDNFNANKERYTPGKHYHCLEGEELRDFKRENGNSGFAENLNKLYLWTEHGALLHAKSLGTDQAWAVYERLIDTYFRARETFAMPRTLPEALRLAADLAEKNQLLTLESVKKDQIIGELRPKADYTDLILKSCGLLTITQIAKDYGMSGQAMNSWLHGLGVQYKVSGDQWLLYSKYHGHGYTQSETVPITRSSGMPDSTMHTKWTQKGRLFLYELLKKSGVLPMIERDWSA